MAAVISLWIQRNRLHANSSQAANPSVLNKASSYPLECIFIPFLDLCYRSWIVHRRAIHEALDMPAFYFRFDQLRNVAGARAEKGKWPYCCCPCALFNYSPLGHLSVGREHHAIVRFSLHHKKNQNARKKILSCSLIFKQSIRCSLHRGWQWVAWFMGHSVWPIVSPGLHNSQFRDSNVTSIRPMAIFYDLHSQSSHSINKLKRRGLFSKTPRTRYCCYAAMSTPKI